MAKIYRINTQNGPIYATAADRSKMIAYSRVLTEYEKGLVARYGKQFNLLITPSEYQKALFLHNQLYNLTQKVKNQQKALKAMFNR